ncbi:hypothetical protein SAMN02745172_00773 [Pseudoxanthobacter soli DSM 19599]|uniref:2OG-Fe(II) oxygenase superfamily protein n=1 Tax=Pseudoxanthobacter soli DSM 19599 TaxID=1123029 RepID=A0A1M7Z996_9HYPH|nr:2OG-Fe(II) oxygenase [Pseudoxanthobacter soli]SHO61454.1 hypothetical protein SAMN02745172_00773 [Pseudoxanthobacter soli DSM 19599]
MTIHQPLSSANEVKATFLSALGGTDPNDSPYRHWLLDGLFPGEAVTALQELPFPAPSLDGVSGTREVHNATRVYFDVKNRAEHPVCDAVAVAFQDPEVVGAIEKGCGCDLDNTYLRIEYAQDVEGFWLQPHTDIGVKRFTMLIYLSGEAGQEDLGTDIYADAQTWVGRSPFAPNKAMIFVPSNNSWHGFERRPIKGVRKSLIINYVTTDWRAREQLSFPEATVHSA